MYSLSILLLSVLSAAEIPSKPTVILRFDAFGSAQALLNCSAESSGCTVPSLTEAMVESMAMKTVCADEVLGDQEPILFCRIDPKFDGSQDSNALSSSLLTWTALNKIPGYPVAYSDEENQLLKRHNLHRFSCPAGSRHGSFKFQAVLRASEEFCQAPTPFGEFLRLVGKLGFQETVREVYNPNMMIPALPEGQKTKYFFTEKDTLSAATAEIERLLAEGKTDPSVMIVNFANNYRPGGGYKNGALAQEEDLFYSSTLPLSLTPHGADSSFYPINDAPNTIVNSLYTPHVHVIRKRDGYKFMSEEEARKYQVSVCSVAALDCSDKLNAAYFSESGDCSFTEAGYEATKGRIGSMFQMAAIHKVDSLVLGAFGCGVFKNNPASISEIYGTQMKAYHNTIPNIIYAIIGDVNVKQFFKSDAALKCPAEPTVQ